MTKAEIDWKDIVLETEEDLELDELIRNAPYAKPITKNKEEINNE